MARLRTIENVPGVIYDEANKKKIFAEDLQGLDNRIYDLESATDKVPSGGTTGQVLSKVSDDDFDIEWATGGGGGSVFDNDLTILNGIGMGVKGRSLFSETISSSRGLDDNSVIFTFCYIPEACSISEIWYYSATIGNYTADKNNKLGLYSVSDGVLTKVAETANNGSLWKTINQNWTYGFIDPAYSASAGVYAIGALYNYSAQTTQPKIGCGVSSINVAVSQYFRNSAYKVSFMISSQDDLANSYNISSGNILSDNIVYYLR